MICIYCGFDTNGEDNCPYCGKDLKIYKRIIRASNIAYNEGLEKARIRDLTGATESLNRCLKLNKYHIEARNLLGLVYFEIGEMVLALREWVISKNFKPSDNRADYYLDELQRGQMNKLDQITKKYNLAIDYCRMGDYDLAKIQLKRVLSKNSSMIHAYQLLALLLLNENNPEAARKQLNLAARIDINNPTTLTYLKEAEEAIKIKNAKKRKRINTEDFQEGETSESYQKRGFSEAIDNSKNSIMNIIIGIIVGILASIFLILPTMQQNSNEDAINALIDANENAVGTENSIASLKDEIEDLKERLEKYEGQTDVKDGYEMLLLTSEYISGEDWESAISGFATINREVLDSKGQDTYDNLSAIINEATINEGTEKLEKALAEDDKQAAIEAYKQILEVDETYDEGNALFSLGDLYKDTEDTENAIETFKRVVELYPDTRLGNRAEVRLRELGASPE